MPTQVFTILLTTSDHLPRAKCTNSFWTIFATPVGAGPEVFLNGGMYAESEEKNIEAYEWILVFLNSYITLFFSLIRGYTYNYIKILNTPK